jgi:YidC/Oxa1 family membrane protein insertase
MMKLYKENNANPISGCLPLLLQLPVFFALFTVIRNFKTDAEAQFGLSAQQLQEGAVAKVLGAPISAAFNSPGSVLDDLGAEALTVRIVAFIMVVGMGASTFWTQRQLMARAGTTDPQQVMVQKLLLYVLPLSFAVSGVFFPIGVLLYWLTTNVWSMGQQAYVIKRMPPPVLDGGAANGKDPQRDKGGPTGGGKPGKGGGAPAAGPTSGSNGTPPAEPGETPAALTSAAGTASTGAGTATSKAVAPPGRRAAGSRKNKNRRGGRR